MTAQIFTLFAGLMVDEPYISLAAIPILVVLVLLAAGAGLVALGAWAYPKLKGETQGYYYEKQIEAVLLPWIYQAIMGAYRLSEMALDEFDVRMHGLDKAQIAGTLYDMLPAKIGNIPVGTVKLVISREQFARLVQDMFDEFDEEFHERADEYRQILGAWKAANG